MQIVINIPEEAYKLLKSKQVLDNIAECIIANGTPLPKGHGDLVDRDALLTDDNISDLNDGYGSAGYFRYVSVNTIKESPTVIPADKEIEK